MLKVMYHVWQFDGLNFAEAVWIIWFYLDVLLEAGVGCDVRAVTNPRVVILYKVSRVS